MFLGFAIMVSLGARIGLGKKSSDLVRLKLDYHRASLWGLSCQSAYYVSLGPRKAL